jgi:hypothetical protein
MATKTKQKTPKIVIVESPKKAREIQKFLGKDFTVKATVGHFKDLPEKEMGVDLKSFEPKFVIKSAKHKKMLSELKKLAKNASNNPKFVSSNFGAFLIIDFTCSGVISWNSALFTSFACFLSSSNIKYPIAYPSLSGSVAI